MTNQKSWWRTSGDRSSKSRPSQRCLGVSFQNLGPREGGFWQNYLFFGSELFKILPNSSRDRVM
jgi:hypothetical protein